MERDRAYDQKSQPNFEAETDESQKQSHSDGKDTESESSQRPSLLPRSSLESTATTLPPYSERPDRPPIYRPRTTPVNSSRPAGASAASISAILATSSSDTDKMHSKHTKKVEDWNEDPTYKGRVARMTGSSIKWNYFGAELGQYGNPFKRFSGKK